ncbi:MAG: hypothetical protein HOO96_29590 [Polyangiaceae bacterium]|nr:hypothetical protein [Polyangiaceae bacterium]
MSYGYGMYGTQDFLIAAQAHRQHLQEALRTAEDARRRHLAEWEQLAVQVNHAAQELGQFLLPNLGAEAIDRAIRLTGYEPLRGFAHQYRQEGAQLTAQRAAIVDDPRYRNRELNWHPNTGTLSNEVRELEESRAPFVPILEACNHPRMPALMESGYGTPAYGVGFWRLSYYRDWEAADSIVEKLGKKDFAEVRTEYERALETSHELTASLNRLYAERTIVQQMEQSLAAIDKAIRERPHQILASAQFAVADHLNKADKDRTGKLLDQEPNARLLALKAQGLAAKLEYLGALYKEKVEKFAADTQAAIAKLDRDVFKYQRPKNYGTRFPADYFARRFADPRPRYQKHWNRYYDTYRTVYVYDDYDRGYWASDFLWWDAMTGGQRVTYIPSVVNHHVHYGVHDYGSSDHRDDAQVDDFRSVDDGDAARAAIEMDQSTDLGTGGGGSAFDPS